MPVIKLNLIPRASSVEARIECDMERNVGVAVGGPWDGKTLSYTALTIPYVQFYSDVFGEYQYIDGQWIWVATGPGTE
jgi:hypothetical protein